MGEVLDLKPLAEPPEHRLGAEFKLSSGRMVRLELPVPFTSNEALELIGMIPNGIAQLNSAVLAGSIALPNGQVHGVPKDIS